MPATGVYEGLGKVIENSMAGFQISIHRIAFLTTLTAFCFRLQLPLILSLILAPELQLLTPNLGVMSTMSRNQE